MDVSKEIEAICEILDLNESELAEQLDVTTESVNGWKSNRKKIDDSNLEKLYSYAYGKGIRLNNIYEQLYKEEYENNHMVVLFHGVKKSFFPIDFASYSKNRNDFGIGFYLGESFEQAANYISFLDEYKIVYCFQADLQDLKTYHFDVNTEWMIAIAYFRG